MYGAPKDDWKDYFILAMLLLGVVVVVANVLAPLLKQH
jgi:hypothetical protein